MHKKVKELLKGPHTVLHRLSDVKSRLCVLRVLTLLHRQRFVVVLQKSPKLGTPPMEGDHLAVASRLLKVWTPTFPLASSPTCGSREQSSGSPPPPQSSGSTPC